jgi:hypothetical protein
MQIDRVRDGKSGPALSAAELAWLAAAPCALIAVLAIVMLGPPLGHALLEPTGTRFWRYDLSLVRPEPVERARYVLAVLSPFALAGCIAALARRGPSRPRMSFAGVLLNQALLLTFFGVCLLAQHVVHAKPGQRAYFTHTTLVVALLIAVLVALVPRQRRVIASVARLCRETRNRRMLAAVLALLLTSAWLLSAINTEGTIGTVNEAVAVNSPLLTDEAFAAFSGAFPLVSFHAAYGELWLYGASLTMVVFGTTFGIFCASMVIASGVAMLAVFATLRRIVKSSLLALMLYAPVLATGFFIEIGPPSNRYAPSNLMSLFPMRYGGSYLLAWLVARHIDHARPHRRAWVFVAAGLVLINNFEFGLPALGATIAALLITTPRLEPASLARLARDAAAGLLGAVTLTAVLTLALAGSLPHLGMLLGLPTLYGIDGFGMLPMPTLGLHLVVYATFVAAVALATVRALQRDEDRLLTGMLAWSGVFGLGAGGYFAGRSHPDVLIAIFSAWAFTLALLSVATVRAIAARPTRRPQPAELAVLFGFGLAVCSLAQTPDPFAQIHRLQQTYLLALRPAAQAAFIASRTKPGEMVAIFAPLGHRMAFEAGVNDVVPYGNLETMVTPGQWEEAIAALHAAGGRKLFVVSSGVQPDQLAFLTHAGFTSVPQDAGAELQQMTRRR